jgi:hypothetical protein
MENSDSMEPPATGNAVGVALMTALLLIKCIFAHTLYPPKYTHVFISARLDTCLACSIHKSTKSLYYYINIQTMLKVR